MNFTALLISFAISYALLVVAMTAHEFSHGWVANRLGDPTAKYSGRLTLNPLAHVDFFWTLLLPLILFLSSSGQFVFGAAKPVPVNYWNLKNPKRDIIWVGLAGPLANLLMAYALALVLKFTAAQGIAGFLLFNLLTINVVLAVFNLIPLPPLDGSKVLLGLLPPGLSRQYAALESYGFIILFLFIWLGLFDRLIWPLVEALIRMMGVGI